MKTVDKLMMLADTYAEEMSGPCPCSSLFEDAREKLLQALVEALEVEESEDTK